MQKVNVSVISFANSIPFLYGLLNSPVLKKINISLDIPSESAEKLVKGKVDIGIIPVVETLRLKTYEIVSDLCIGADDYVKTVILAAKCPINEIETVYLDYDSRTSVMLAQILAQKHWKICVKWIHAGKNFDIKSIHGKNGAVLIGDKTFGVNTKYIYDLSHEWYLFTGLPFVFATWVANKKIDPDFLKDFNSALHYGIENIENCTTIYQNPGIPKDELIAYLKNNIQYDFDVRKQKAVEKFLIFANELINAPISKTSVI
jgi:chorismate dehydratase